MERNLDAATFRWEHTHKHTYMSVSGPVQFWVMSLCLGATRFTLTLEAWCPIRSHRAAVCKLLPRNCSSRWRKNKDQTQHTALYCNKYKSCFCNPHTTTEAWQWPHCITSEDKIILQSQEHHEHRSVFIIHSHSLVVQYCLCFYISKVLCTAAFTVLQCLRKWTEL